MMWLGFSVSISGPSFFVMRKAWIALCDLAPVLCSTIPDCSAVCKTFIIRLGPLRNGTYVDTVYERTIRMYSSWCSLRSKKSSLLCFQSKPFSYHHAHGLAVFRLNVAREIPHGQRENPLHLETVLFGMLSASTTWRFAVESSV